MVAKKNIELLGFGRLRNHSNTQEMCSLGVLPEYRHKGIGELLVAGLIKLATQDVFLVCIIPDYFKPFGFKIVTDFPEEMKEKLHYCSSELVVEERYVVMGLFPLRTT